MKGSRLCFEMVEKENIFYTERKNFFNPLERRREPQFKNHRFIEIWQCMLINKSHWIIRYHLLSVRNYKTQFFSLIMSAAHASYQGHDTIAISIIWTLFLIGHHPEVQAKLHEELNRILGKDEDVPISVADLNNLHYMECVIKVRFSLIWFYNRYIS